MVQLRPYQESVVEAVRDAYRRGRRAPLVQVPTGGGKTIIFSHITHGAGLRGNRVWILVHRRELLRQASSKLAEGGVEHGLISPGYTPTRDLVQVASVQTLAVRLKAGNLAPPNLIVIDEAHHAVAGQWAKVLAAFPEARLLGVTATPQRLDGRGLGVSVGGPFDEMVIGPTVAELIAGGFLSPAKVWAPADGPDLSGVRTRGGDFEAGSLAAAMAKPKLVGDAVEHYRKHAAGLPCIAFCASVAHAEQLAEAFRADGWRAKAVDGTTHAVERDAAIGGLATGATQVLCSCDLISEGLDVPAVGAVILMRPTKSLGLYLQQVGRGLRPAPGKDFLRVLDHAGNTHTHGFIEDEREWTLDGRKKRDRNALPPTRSCPQCFAVFAPAPTCPECDFVFPVREREIQHVAGMLAELSPERRAFIASAPLRQVLAEVKTEAELRAIQKARGYNHGWIRHVMREHPAFAGLPKGHVP